MRAVAHLIDLSGIDLMIPQLSLSWSPPIGEVFQSNDTQCMNKSDIKTLVDQLALAKLRGNGHQLLGFLASVCAPGGVTDARVQKWVLQMVVGDLAAVVASSLAHVLQSKQAPQQPHQQEDSKGRPAVARA